jgi:hypothetical protein
MNLSINCLSLLNKRKVAVTEKFRTLGLEVFVCPGVSYNDSRIDGKNLSDNDKKVWSTCYGHLEMIHRFYNQTDCSVGIFCEDDILIHKDFKSLLPKIYEEFEKMNFEVLLIGYLCENEIDKYSNYKTIKYFYTRYKFLEYPDDGTWGTQMYMLSRKSAGEILNLYYEGYADKTLNNKSLTPFASDWLITKYQSNSSSHSPGPKRALIYPQIVIEDDFLNKEKYTPGSDVGQTEARDRCYMFSYKPDTFF